MSEEMKLTMIIEKNKETLALIESATSVVSCNLDGSMQYDAGKTASAFLCFMWDQYLSEAKKN